MCHNGYCESCQKVSIRQVSSTGDISIAEFATDAPVATERQHPLADELYRYLNFFELLAGLRELRQISKNEIKRLVGYDLKMISQHDFLVQALKPQGFEQLAKLITTIPLLPDR